MATGHKVAAPDNKTDCFEIYQTAQGWYWEFKHHHNATSSNDKPIKRRENAIRAAREFHCAISGKGTFGWMEVKLPELLPLPTGG